VKYHKGFSSDLRTPGGNVHVALSFNPSHLEIVNPVVEGSVRARQERRHDTQGRQVLPVLVHGDAAFAGQGVVMETLQLSQTRGYATGGTVHIVVNNQVGFTTSDPRDARSTSYCSDVAKMIEAPILHVNADDLEAVIFCTRLALRYRQEFHKDFVIDLVCYRRLGHNESDEPAATQPMMYKAIRQHPTVRKLYAEQLSREGLLTSADSDQLVAQYRQALDEGRHQMHPSLGMIGNQFTVNWSQYLSVDWTERVRTAVEPARLAALGRRILQFPSDFTLHPRVAQVVVNRPRCSQASCHSTGAVPRLWPTPRCWMKERPYASRARCRARHVLPPPRGAARSEQRSRLYPLQHIREDQPISRSSTRVVRRGGTRL